MSISRRAPAQRLNENEAAMARLACVALHPSMRAFIACAQSDLTMVARHARQLDSSAECEALDRCVASIERQLVLATKIIEMLGPGAPPPSSDISRRLV